MRVAIILVLALPLVAQQRVVVRPADTGVGLVNPSMGWTMMYYSNILSNYGSTLAASDTLDDFPGLAVVYLRLPWSHIEAEEGKFDWSIVDAPAQRWIDKGKQVAFRFTCCESFMRYATPQWVEQAGAKGKNFTVGKGVDEKGPFWEPDYGDPVLLEKLDHFLAAAAKRYDGNPNVAFIDVGSFGVWGEGHTGASTRLTYGPAVVKKHIDLYAKHFRKTLLAANDDFASQGEGIIEHARSLGMTLRDDSILVQPPPRSWYHAEMAKDFWPRLPVILEHEHWKSSIQRKAWKSELFLKAIEDYHASYMSIHWFGREFLEKERELIGKANLRLGYRLQLREASWPARASLKGPVEFVSSWANAGVAPCYPGGHVAFTLKDEKGGVVAVFVDEGFNVKALAPAEPGKAVAAESRVSQRIAPNVPSGKFGVFVSVGDRDGTPRIALPLEKEDGRRRYWLGEVELEK